jgi:hypothetical protein
MSVYRIYYIETTGETMPERSDLCIQAISAKCARRLASEVFGTDFKILRVKKETRPSNIIKCKDQV